MVKFRLRRRMCLIRLKELIPERYRWLSRLYGIANGCSADQIKDADIHWVIVPFAVSSWDVLILCK